MLVTCLTFDMSSAMFDSLVNKNLSIGRLIYTGLLRISVKRTQILLQKNKIFSLHNIGQKIRYLTTGHSRGLKTKLEEHTKN